MADTTRCPRCGAADSSTGVSGMCGSCLLELALLPPDDALDGEDDGNAPPTDTAYRVVTILAADAAGSLYLAEEDRTRRLVTLHVVKLEQPADGGGQQAFRDRVLRLRRLVHPAIPAVIDARMTPSGDGCVVAAHVNGPQLRRYCQSAAVDGATRARLFQQVCDAIEYAHRLGICHGRLGPDSVIVRMDEPGGPSPMVLGFSLAPTLAPGPAADLAGLASIARSMGWTGAAPDTWPSIEALRDKVCDAFASGADR